MKNVFDNLPFKQKGVRKVLTIMRAVIFIMFVAVFQLAATSSYSHETMFSVKENGIELSELFSQIEEQSEFRFFYLDADVKDIRVNVNVKKDNVHTILGKVLKDTDLTFMVNDRNVNILRKSNLEASPQQSAKRQITGVVTDESGDPVIGANIVEIGTTNGITTDVDGKFSLNVGEKASIRVSYIGYITQDISATGQQSLTIILKEDTQGLEEVVVVGYGVQRKVTLTGSVAQVSGGLLKQAPTANLSNTLVGRLPGVIANNRTGQPGSDNSEIFIRGKSTLGNNTPLYVIDGLANFGDIQRLNPSDIESVSVLKDVSAAIYGAQAANGVILITTKRGNSGKPIISYEGNFGLSQNTRTPNLMNSYQYMVYNDEAEAYLGRIEQFKDVKGGYLDGTIDKLLWADTD